MLPLEWLDRARTPDDRELALIQRGEEFFIQLDREELMSSRAVHSEEELARLAIGNLGDRRAPRILVGGLGMGYTLRAALDALGGRRAARVVVAELMPDVVRWNRTWLGHLAARPLDDPRVEVVVGDVAHVVAGAAEPFDAILLDVDNGPQGMTQDANDRLYSRRGLRHLGLALAPGGVLGVWSAHHEPRFAARMRHCGFTVSTHRMHAVGRRRGRRHVVYLAQGDSNSRSRSP